MTGPEQEASVRKDVQTSLIDEIQAALNEVKVLYDGDFNAAVEAAERKLGVRELTLVKDMQDVGLVFCDIHRPLELHNSGLIGLRSRVMASRHPIGAKRQSMLEQQLPANRPIAFQARIGCLSSAVRIDERLHNCTAKCFLGVHDIERDVQDRGRPARQPHGFRGAAPVRTLFPGL